MQFTQANSSFAITTAAAGNASVNGAFAELYMPRQTGLIVRRVVGPSATDLRLPILPTAQADLNVLVADSASVGGVAIIASSGGYDALRPLFYSIDDSSEILAATPTVNGQLCVSLYVPPM